MCLLPLSWVWAAITRVRRVRHESRAKRPLNPPVVCFGNLHSGGTGKTPLVREFCRRYESRRPAILTRGYGGSVSRKGEALDRTAAQGFVRYGDEAWMLARTLPCPIYVGRDRARWYREAKDVGVFVLDDGFQNFGIEKTLSILLIPASESPDNAFCLPLGELREPLGALDAADAVVLMEGKHAPVWRGLLSERFPRLPIFDASRSIEPGPAPREGETYVAFSGIARPAVFEAEAEAWVRAHGATYGGGVRFRDHHAYSKVDARRLAGAAARLVTTEKDWSKVEGLFDDPPLVMRIGYRLPEDFWRLVETRLGF